MAEEDLMWGKNRHFFGGIEPSNITNFAIRSYYDYENDKTGVKLTGELPSDTIVDGQTLCTVAGCVIRKSTEGYPTDEFSGDLVEDVKLNFAELSPSYTLNVTDYDVAVGETYYYSAFPYTMQGVYNRNYNNRGKITVVKCEYLYGYDLTTSTSSPSARVTYSSDVDNADFTPAAMNYTAGTFNYGSWNSEVGKGFMPRPCMLNYDGTVYEYLNPNDYTKNVDGGASQVASTSFGGNAMIEWGKIYTKRWEEDGVYHFRCSDQKLDEDYDCWCNYDRKDNVIEHFYTPIYFGSNVSSKLRSISGQGNSVSTTASTEITYAQANGDDWYIECFADRWLITDLLVMMARTTDTQTAYGAGWCGSSSAIGQGTMNTKGMFFGYSSTTGGGVKVFGMENWWGNLWRRCAGLINASGTQKVKITRGTHDGSTATDFNLDGSGYISIASATPAGTSRSYISACKTEKFGRIPYQASGSSSTYDADGLWFNNGQVDYAIVGGAWSHALLCGAFCVNLNNLASFAYSDLGACLSCKPCA